ncbi:hypothetical protein HDU91_004429 [Kappamyces sp. JEL0680]|nr:hypothetical protein HDU91_004429 [Kappamyces sp. JEL0680]
MSGKTPRKPDTNVQAAPAVDRLSGNSDFLTRAVSMRIGSLFSDEVDAQTNYTSDSNTPDLTDTLTLNSILQQAMIDTEGFTILLPERYLEQKKRLVQITNYLESLQNKLSLELKVKEATENILKFNSDDRAQVDEAQRQLQRSQTKMNDISKVQAERTVMKHLGGALRWYAVAQMLTVRKVDDMSQTMSNAPTLKVKRGDQDSQRKLKSAEDRVKELEAQVQVLKTSVARMEFEQEPLRELAAGAQRQARKALEQRDALKQSPNDQPSSLEFNRAKLDYATAQTELTELKEELAALKDSQASLQLQLEDDQGLIQSKDRMIANLLSELEEATNKIEMSRAGGKIIDGAGNASLSRMMGRKNRNNSDTKDTDSDLRSVMATQLKEAVLEREKLKLQLDQEMEKSLDLETKLNRLKTSRRDSDTEPDTPRSPRAPSSRTSAVGRRTPPTPRTRAPATTPTDYSEQEKLAGLQAQVEEHLGVVRNPFTITKLVDGVQSLIQKSQIATGNVKESQREQAILQDTVQALEAELQKRKQGTLETRNREARNDPSATAAELREVKRRLVESEKLSSKVPELQSIIDDQAKRIKEFSTQRNMDLTQQTEQLEAAKNTLKSEIATLKQQHEENITKLKLQHNQLLADYKAQLDREKLDILTNQEREMQNAKKSWLEEMNAAFEQKLTLVKQQNESQLQEVAAAAELEKTQFKAMFQKDQIESRSRLELAEQALVDSKQQFFNEREKYQEKLDILQAQLQDMEQRFKQSLDDWNARKAELQKINDKLQDEIDQLQTSISDSNRKLEVKSRELLEIQGIHDLEMKATRQEYETQMLAMDNKMNELKSSQKKLASAEEQFAQQSAVFEAEIKRLNELVQQSKTKANQDVEKAQESLFDATDQLDRVQRLLKDVNGDVDRYRKLADERDQEVLTLKRQLRTKEKELTEGAMSGTNDASSVRRILAQKDKEIDSIRAELRSSQAEVSSWKRKVEVKDREIEDAKSQMRRAARGDKDEQADEIARLQIMLLDLKTTRVELLEKLDDAEHEAEMLRNEVKALKAGS